MSRAWSVAVIGVVSALVGAFLLSVLYRTNATVVLDMDRDLPRFTSGFYPIERDGDLTYAWSSDRSVIRLAGLDRRVAWSCTARVRGSRGVGIPQPDVMLSVDGAAGIPVAATNEFQDLMLVAPERRGRSGLTLTIRSAPSFVPGPDDTRVLGVQVDRVTCLPAAGWFWPPMRAVAAAAVGAGVLGLALAIAGVVPLVAMAIAMVVALGQGLLLTIGGGLFGTYPDLVARVAAAIALALIVVVHGPRLIGREALAGTARLVVVISLAALFLELLALAHPAKLVVDAVFQAHRLEWVLGGRYFFTQPLPDGVQFPYAIGLYVTAAPLAVWITDHVLLLRVVVLVTTTIAGLLLYPLVSEWWGDRRAGLLAVTLYHVVPLPYVVIGNANLPNVFGQAVALLVLAAVVGLRAGPGARTQTVMVAALTSLAFLSHVSTLLLLTGTLAAVVCVYTLLGGGEGRRGAVVLVATTAVALVLAAGLYYRHFPEVYTRAFERVLRTSTAESPALPVASDRPAALVRPLAWHERAGDAVAQTIDNVGWPILVLAAVGAWVTARARSRDRLSLLLLAWCGAWVTFLLIGTATRVDTQYQRYAAEFIGRVNLAGYPAAVLLAARGLAWAWGPGAPRAALVAGLGLFSFAIVLGVRSWIGWVR